MSATLILASSSPRRQEILKQVNLSFQIRKPEIDESVIHSADPVEKVSQLASAKGKVIPIQHEQEIILSADTVVSMNQQIFEKPKNKQEAHEMITALSGGTHDVFTGVMIRSAEREVTFTEQTQVEFWPLTNELINRYIETEEPYDKAGAYGIQSMGAMFVKQITGDYYNVVGLPVSRVVRELQHFSSFNY
jgi:septum formation protein